MVLVLKRCLNPALGITHDKPQLDSFGQGFEFHRQA
jgi:hypothetical protein